MRIPPVIPLRLNRLAPPNTRVNNPKTESYGRDGEIERNRDCPYSFYGENCLTVRHRELSHNNKTV